MFEALVAMSLSFEVILVVLVLILVSTLEMLPRDKFPSISALDLTFTELSKSTEETKLVAFATEPPVKAVFPLPPPTELPFQ